MTLEKKTQLFSSAWAFSDADATATPQSRQAMNAFWFSAVQAQFAFETPQSYKFQRGNSGDDTYANRASG